MKKNNKGFSLVELIIVIAIMAVLVAVLAPQYIKYVEKSRQSKDAAALDEILRSAQAAVIDPANTATAGTITVTVDGTSGGVTIGNGAGADVKTAMDGTLGTVKMSSTRGKALGELSISVDLTAGVKWDSASQTKIDGVTAK